MDWYFKVLSKYATFTGRAHRREFWLFILVSTILWGVLRVVDKILGWQHAGGFGTLSLLYSLLVLVPTIAVQVRRLHDTDRSWRWLLLLLFPVIGWLALLAFYSQHGTEGENRFGERPGAFP